MADITSAQAPLPVITVRGRPVLALPPSGSALPSTLVFGMHKGGSSLLDRLVSWLCASAGHPFVPVMHAFFRAGIETAAIPPETAAVFRTVGYCYGSFRAFPREFDIPILAEAHQLLLVRDPRDMLTSLYFATRRSRVGDNLGPADRAAFIAASQDMDIDRFVLAHADKYVEDFAGYERHLAPARLRLLRYEDVIYDKARLVAEVAAHVGLTLPGDRIERMAERLDEMPAAEQPDRHLRQAHPGDHRRKLAPETIAALDRRFAPILDRYGYERG
jgi:hypothetical protein